MIRPLTGQALIQLLPPDEKTDGGLFVPEIVHDNPNGEKAKPRRGIVIAVGHWRQTKEGFAILPDFKPGETVLLSEYAGTKLTRAIGENLRLCRVDDVLAVLTNGQSGPH